MPEPVSDAFPADTLVLRVVAGPAMGEVVPVSEDFEIGRQAPSTEGKLGNDIEISRHHARIHRDAEGRFLVEDLGSTNGTYVNSERVTGPRALKTHDVIEMGDTRVIVLHPREAPSLGEPEAVGGAAGATTFAEVQPEASDEPTAPVEEEPAEEAAPVEAAEPPEVEEPPEAAAPEAAPVPAEADAAPSEAEALAEPEPEPVPEPEPEPVPEPEPEPVSEPEPEPELAAPPVDDAPPPVEFPTEPMPAPVAPPPEPEAAPAAPADAAPAEELPAAEPAAPVTPMGVSMSIDPASGAPIIEVDDPAGAVRFVKRDGSWTIEPA